MEAGRCVRSIPPVDIGLPRDTVKRRGREFVPEGPMRCSNCDGEVPVFGSKCPKCRSTQRSITLGGILGLLFVGLLISATAPQIGAAIVLVALALGGKFVVNALRQPPPKLTSYELEEPRSLMGGPGQVIEIPIPPFEDGDTVTSGKLRVSWNVTEGPAVSITDGSSAVDRLAQLQEMRNRGLISAKEFAEKRAEILKGL